ncbi:MAG: leucyl aminopeptidase [Lachnospiraceae bacterium]|nr:leucyl aminopeptidase [Lachnospiraceae bacterium]
MSLLEERFELAMERIHDMVREQEVAEKFSDYFKQAANFVCMMTEAYDKVQSGWMKTAELDELRAFNHKIYEDILGENYERSYANPAYAVARFGLDMGRLLAFLMTELRAMIPFSFEGLLEELLIRMELLLEVYGAFSYAYAEGQEAPDSKELQESLYWFVSDYSEPAAAWRVKTQVDATEDFAVRVIMDNDLTDLRYLYQYGEYISEDIEKMATYLNSLPEERVQMMADTYTEGYRIGFVKDKKPLHLKETVDVRYVAGFERMMKFAIANFEKMGLKPTIYRAAASIFHKKGNFKIGYYGAIANKQFEYDHKDDIALFLDKKLVQRRLEVLRQAYEENKEVAAKHAGPAVLEVFGEIPFAPVSKPEACALSDEQKKLSSEYTGASTGIVYEYINGEERSFTIIAFPVPEIGDKFEEIFDETVKINTLDYKTYERMQAIIIDTLDKANYVEIKGMNGNKTDLRIQLYPLQNPKEETIFENCVADVNIPVGEVFTSPVLEGTEGKLHVSRVFLNELEYLNLEMDFVDGKITEYTCTNFEKEEENKEYLKSNVLFNYDSLPIGEFAIGTNTTAYMAAKKYDIGSRLPILIAEKTGPHFAVGDTCYSRSEEVKMYNENGKEIVAKDNSVSILRKTDPAKAYFGCHTDITIPYDELGSIIAYDNSGNSYPIIIEGRFVLEGCEELNAPFDAATGK